MKGDSIIVEAHHETAASDIVTAIFPAIEHCGDRYTISVAGQSGSGKSEVTMAIARVMATRGVQAVIFQQDDYFVNPPKTNDKMRRANLPWVGTQEVKLFLLDRHLSSFLHGATEIEKPVVDYAQDAVFYEVMEIGKARAALADGTYTSLLKNIMCRVFIDLDFMETWAHRQKRRRHDSELDPFIDRVLKIEREIILAHKNLADIIVNKDYSITIVNGSLQQRA